MSAPLCPQHYEPYCVLCGWRSASAAQTSRTHACNCVGPQNGQPRCPCMMHGVIQRDGRWIEPERDLGPIRNTPADTPLTGGGRACSSHHLRAPSDISQ